MKDISPYVPSPQKEGIFLNANESPFNIPDLILDEFKKRIGEIKFNRYPDSDCENLKKTVAKFYGMTDKNVAFGVGSDDLIDIVLKSTIDNNKLMTLKPTFSMYNFYGKINCAKLVELLPDENLKHSVNDIINTVKDEKPAILIICNPNNPTGEVFSKVDMEKIISSTDALVIVDEAYAEFSNISVIDLVTKYDNLVVLRTFSKAYSFAEARLGYIISNESFIKMIESVKSPYRINTVNLILGEIIIENASLYSNRIKYIQNETKRLYNELKKIDGIKVYETAANFVLFQTDEKLFNELEKQNIIVRKFVIDGLFYIRVNAGLKEENDLFLSEVKKYYA